MQTQPIQKITLDQIDIHGGTQTRVKTNEEAIESYAEEMNNGTVFPPITLFFDGATYWLADGFHRYLAAKRIGLPAIDAEVKAGGRIDALKHALGANATNGVYRTNADKRNAAAIALEEWPGLANTVIAEICRVSADLVRTRRKELEQAGKIERPQRVVGRDGKEYPAEIERELTEQTDEKAIHRGGGASAGEGGGGGGGGKPSTKGDGGAPGGTNAELEREARAMMHRGEMNPFELCKLMSVTAHDYATTIVNLLNTMPPHAPKREEALLRLKRFIERVLAGEIVLGAEAEWSGAPSAPATSAVTDSRPDTHDADEENEDGSASEEEADENSYDADSAASDEDENA
jgi:Predicted transcriptional regulators